MLESRRLLRYHEIRYFGGNAELLNIDSVKMRDIISVLLFEISTRLPEQRGGTAKQILYNLFSKKDYQGITEHIKGRNERTRCVYQVWDDYLDSPEYYHKLARDRQSKREEYRRKEKQKLMRNRKPLHHRGVRR